MHGVFLFPLQDNPNRFGMSENEAFFALAIKEHLAQPVAIPHNLVEYFLVQPNPSNPRQMQMFMELLHCESMLLRMHVHTYVCIYVRMYVCTYVRTCVCMYVCTVDNSIALMF